MNQIIKYFEKKKTNKKSHKSQYQFFLFEISKAIIKYIPIDEKLKQNQLKLY